MNQITERDFTDPSYAEEVERHFGALRGRVVNFTGDDFRIVKAWEDEKIPLPVVVRTLEDEFKRKGGDIGTIRYFRDIVPKRAKDRAAAMVGGHREQQMAAPVISDNSVEERMQAKLFNLVDDIQARATGIVDPLQTTMEAVAFELLILAQSGAHLVYILERLEVFDEQLVAAAVESLAGDDRADIERRALRTLSPAQSGDQAARAAMLETMVRGAARTRFKLGSLFESIQEVLQ